MEASSLSRRIVLTRRGGPFRQENSSRTPRDATARCHVAKEEKVSQDAPLLEADEPPVPQDDVVQDLDAQELPGAGGVPGQP